MCKTRDEPTTATEKSNSIYPDSTRYDRSWGHLFSTFEDFLAFSWPVITVTDALTGRAHIVTRMTSIGAFLKMIKTRYVNAVPSNHASNPLSRLSSYLAFDSWPWRQIRRNYPHGRPHSQDHAFRDTSAALAYYNGL